MAIKARQVNIPLPPPPRPPRRTVGAIKIVVTHATTDTPWNCTEYVGVGPGRTPIENSMTERRYSPICRGTWWFALKSERSRAADAEISARTVQHPAATHMLDQMTQGAQPAMRRGGQICARNAAMEPAVLREAIEPAAAAQFQCSV